MKPYQEERLSNLKRFWLTEFSKYKWFNFDTFLFCFETLVANDHSFRYPLELDYTTTFIQVNPLQRMLKAVSKGLCKVKPTIRFNKDYFSDHEIHQLYKIILDVKNMEV